MNDAETDAAWLILSMSAAALVFYFVSRWVDEWRYRNVKRQSMIGWIQRRWMVVREDSRR